MTRQELKTAWFNIDHSNTPVRKEVIVTMGKSKFWPGYGEVQILSEGPDGYSSFKTHQENPVKYAKDIMKENDGHTDYSEYKLVIDGEIEVPCSKELDNEWAIESE